MLGQNRLQHGRVERAAKSDHRLEHLTGAIVGQTLVQRLHVGAMRPQIVEERLVEHVRRKHIGRQNLQQREGHDGHKAKTTQPLGGPQHAMRRDHDRRRFRQSCQRLHRRDRHALDNQTRLCRIVIDNGVDRDAALSANPRQPSSFGRGPDDRKRMQVSDIERAAPVPHRIP